MLRSSHPSSTSRNGSSPQENFKADTTYWHSFTMLFQVSRTPSTATLVMVNLVLSLTYWLVNSSRQLSARKCHRWVNTMLTWSPSTVSKVPDAPHKTVRCPTHPFTSNLTWCNSLTSRKHWTRLSTTWEKTKFSASRKSKHNLSQKCLKLLTWRSLLWLNKTLTSLNVNRSWSAKSPSFSESAKSHSMIASNSTTTP